LVRKGDKLSIHLICLWGAAADSRRGDPWPDRRL